MHLFEYRKGHLFCEDVNLETLAKEAGTPVYVYSANTILNHYRRLDAAFSGLDHLICYAVKANSNIAILNLLAKENSGFDIVSSGELYRVEKAGGKPEQCTFAGVGKTENEIKFALVQGILSFNVESESELAYINHVAGSMNRRAPVALRVNPNVDADTHKYISTGKSENKFGIGIDRVMDVYAAASKMPNIRIRGVQMHIGSQITTPKPFMEAVAKMAPMVSELQEKYGIEFFSIGGGIGIVYDPALESGSEGWWKEQAGAEKSALTVEAYAKAVTPSLKKLGLRILFEPGRYMVGNAGVLLTKALYVKKSPSKKFVIVDAGMNDLIRPALYEGYHEVVPLKEPESTKTEVADIVGPVCESGDFFAQDREMPVIEEGDTIALMSAGAYGFSMSSNYNSRPLLAEVLVDGKNAEIIRERQLHADLIRGEIIPESAK
ncbi:MAG: diaminopimelate decarboxylase [Chthoniobacteraceae bacterium]